MSQLEQLEKEAENEEVQIFLIDEEKNELIELDRQDLINSYIYESNFDRQSVHNSLEKSLSAKGYRDRKLTKKDFEHSNQSKEELKAGGLEYYKSLEKKIATLPYNPCDLSRFIEINPLHKQACQLKARDTAGRDYVIKPKYPIRKNNSDSVLHGNFTEEEQFQSDCKVIQDFIDNCNEQQSFQELGYLTAFDREMIGWGAFEVIRRADGKVAKLNRIPAERLRVLQGWEGFLEVSTERQLFEDREMYTYYQPFGKKVQVEVPDPFDVSAKDEESARKVLVDYDPKQHGELNFLTNKKLRWNLKSKRNSDSISFNAANFMTEAANEVIYLPKVHPNTVYYGYSDIISASHAVRTIANIESYVSQFFLNNCVPRYAVIIKGGKVAPDFVKKITDYFTKNVRGSNGSTFVLALPSAVGKMVDIEFRRLDADQKEADFLETKKSYQQDILTAHEVPPSLLQVHDSASLGSGKGTAQAESYKDRFVVPTQRIWAQKLNKLFKLGLGAVHAEITYDPLDVKDARTTADVLNILLINGVLTINEARRELGLDPVKNGDIAIIRVREGSFVRVDQIDQIKSKLLDGDFDVENDEQGNQGVALESLTEDTDSQDT